ncbi:MAG TPA: hypothetical protein VFZ53_24605, partial [Polyangiaceae bacterium]
MKVSVFCLCLGLGFGLATSASSALGEPRGIFRPTLVAGAISPSAGVFAAGAEGAEWMLPGGATIVAEAGTELRVVGTPQRLPLGPRKDTPGYTVMLRSGRLRVSVPRDGRSAVVIGAPRKTNVLVTAGSVSVIASNEQVAVANTDADASLGVGSDPLRALPVGMLRVVDAGAGASRPLAASPSSLDVPSVALSFGGDAALGALRWPASEGASGYRVEIRNEKGRVVGSRETRSMTIESGAFRLAPGKYVARVAGIDATGLEGARPVERPIQVVGVSVPERGFVDADGAVHVPPGRALELSHGGEVELTYGGGSHFITAPKKLDLSSAEPRLVRFRAPGSTSEAKLWLLPRQVRARIEFGPSVPTWPKDTLEIRVRIDDPSSRDRTSSDAPIEVRPRVLLGVEPV